MGYYQVGNLENKDDIGTFYRLISGSDIDRNKISFSFPRIREVEKRKFFGKKVKLKEEFVETIITNVYAVKKDDGIYEVITNKRIHLVPRPEEGRSDVNFIYCKDLEKLSTNEEILKMNKDIKILSNLDKKLVEKTISEFSHNAVISFWIAIMMGSVPGHEKKHNSSRQQYHAGLKSNEEIISEIEEKLNNLRKGKVKKIGRYYN